MPDSDSTPDIETGADTLLSFLEEKTKWPVSKIADELGVPEDTVKNWAKALEKSGLVEIKYSAIKGMVLEYASDKSYEELNQGRSEFALEADEIEIEAEEVETVEETDTVEEDSEGEEKSEEDSSDDEETENKLSETKHEEESENGLDIDEDEEIDGIDTLEQKDLGLDNDSDEIDVEEAKLSEKNDSDEEKLSNDLEDGGLDKDPEDMTEEEGKEKLKEELERLENEKKNESEEKEEEPQTATLDAKKAKIKKKNGNSGEENKEKSESSKEGLNDQEMSEVDEDHESMVDRVHDHVSSSSSGDVDHEAGENLDEVLESIEDLGDLLRDEEVSNGEIYGRLEHEMEALKNVLVEEEVTDDMKKDVARTMQIVESDIENASEPKGILSRIKEYLIGVRRKLP